MQYSKKRNTTIDVLKGIAVILVLLGHAIQRGLVYDYENNLLFKLIYTIHMPLFTFLSGYTLYLSNADYSYGFITKRFKRLILPTAIFSIAIYFVKDLNFVGIEPFVIFPESFTRYLIRLIVSPDFIIWFLYVIFICNVIFFIGKKWLTKYFEFYLLLVTLAVLFFPIVGYFGVWRIKLHLPIFICGYYVAMNFNIIKPKLKYFLVPAVVFYTVFAHEWNFGSSLLYQWLIAFSGILILYVVVKVINISWLDTVLVWLGRYSMEIYIWQIFVLNIGFGGGWQRISTIFITATILSSLLAYLTTRFEVTNKLLYGRF